MGFNSGFKGLILFPSLKQTPLYFGKGTKDISMVSFEACFLLF